MEFEVLKNKKIVDGEMDLLSTYLKIDFDKVIIDDWILVDEFSEMLLDLISYVKFGSDEYVDILIKFNRISNPLEICKGDIIAVPNLSSFRENSKYIDLNKESIVTKKRNNKVNINNAPSKMSKSSNYIKRGGNIII